MNKCNKLAHGVVLAFFGMGCWFVWGVLQLPAMVKMHGVEQHLPPFTTLCTSVGSWVVIGLAVVAAAYCLWVWFGKKDRHNSWVVFLAAATGTLLLVMLPIIIAIYLPLVDALQHIPVN
jgi:hypothetical protein